MIDRAGKGLVGLAAVMAVAGCVYSRARVDESGVFVSDQTLQQVEVGKTKRDWVIATLGEPTSVSLLNEQPKVEMLRYEQKVDHEEGSWVVVIGSEKQRKFTRSTFFEVTDGIVTRYWRDVSAPGDPPKS